MRAACLLSIAVLAAVLVLVPARALACSCAQVTPHLALEEHTAVFEGRVASIRRTESHLEVTLGVVQYWKGIETEEVTVRTAGNEAGCGVAFEPETSWLVYADRRGEFLVTSLCSRTRRIEDASEDLAVHGAGVVPIEIGPEDEVEDTVIPPESAGCASCSIGGRRASPLALLSVVAVISFCRWRSRR